MLWIGLILKQLLLDSTEVELDAENNDYGQVPPTPTFQSTADSEECRSEINYLFEKATDTMSGAKKSNARLNTTY